MAHSPAKCDATDLQAGATPPVSGGTEVTSNVAVARLGSCRDRTNLPELSYNPQKNRKKKLKNGMKREKLLHFEG